MRLPWSLAMISILSFLKIPTQPGIFSQYAKNTWTTSSKLTVGRAQVNTDGSHVEYVCRRWKKSFAQLAVGE